MDNRPDRSAYWAGKTSLETNMVFRAAAIAAVVSNHSNLLNLRGGAVFLLALAGFNFRRFKLKSFLRDDSPWPSTLRYERKILLPYLIAVIAYFAWKGVWEWDVFFAFSNLRRVGATAIFPIWFIQVLVQCTLLVAVIFSFKAVRTLAAKPGIGFSVLLLVAAALISYGVDQVVDLNHLYRRTPVRFMSLLFLGWACASAETRRERVIMVGLTLIYAVLLIGWNTTFGWLCIGLTAILVIPEVTAPRPIADAVNTTARASYYIFLMHMGAFHILHLAGLHHPAILWTGGMTLGIVGWFVFDRWMLHRVLLASSRSTAQRVVAWRPGRSAA